MNQSARSKMFTELINSRQSIQQYKSGHIIPEQELIEMVALAHTAPSAWNLQH